MIKVYYLDILLKKKNNGTLIPIPEILSYEGYLGESSKNNEECTSRSQYIEMSDDTMRRLFNAIINLNETERQQFLINEIRNNPDIRIRTRTVIRLYINFSPCSIMIAKLFHINLLIMNFMIVGFLYI